MRERKKNKVKAYKACHMRALIYFLEGIGSGTVGEKIERSRVQKFLIFIFFFSVRFF